MDIQADIEPEKGLIFLNEEEMRKFISTYEFRTLSKYVVQSNNTGRNGFGQVIYTIYENLL